MIIWWKPAIAGGGGTTVINVIGSGGAILQVPNQAAVLVGQALAGILVKT
jgi:hypothetical protein